MARAPRPEVPTLAERFIGLFRLPYLIGCVLFVASLAILSTILIAYFESFDFARATASLVTLTLPGTLAFFLLVFYAFNAPHYMRKRLLHAEEAISTVLPNGETDFHKLFGTISNLKPQLTLWIVFLTLSVLLVLSQQALNYAQAVTGLGVFASLTLGFSSTIWAYVSALRGTIKIGGAPLRLRPYYQDRLLGLRAVGSLALSFVTAYFVFIGINFLLFVLTPQPLSSYVFLSGLVVLGLLLFFLPLTRLHRLMVRQKTLEKAKLDQILEALHRNLSETNPPSDLNRLFLSLSVSDMMKKEISSIASWPFDTQVLGRLIAVVSTITAILLSRIIQGLFGG